MRRPAPPRPRARAGRLPIGLVERQPLGNVVRIAPGEAHQHARNAQALSRPRQRARRLDRLLDISARVRPVGLLSVRLGAHPAPGRLSRSRARPPQADEPGDERHQKDLAGQHLEHGQDLADVPGRHQIAVAGRRQRRVAEEQVVASLRVSDTGEHIACHQASEREEQEAEQQAEQREDADRPEDRSEIDLAR